MTAKKLARRGGKTRKKRPRAATKKTRQAVPKARRRSPSSVPSVPLARPGRAGLLGQAVPGGEPSPSSPSSALVSLAARRSPSRGQIDALLPGLAQALRGVTLLLEVSKLTTHQMTVLIEALAPLQARLPQAVLVKAYGHSRKMLSAWQKEGAARNADANKTWNHPALDKWLRERWKAQRTQQLPLEVNWEERLKKARALAAERDFDLSQGRLVSRDLVERLFAELADVLVLALTRLPDLAGDLAGGSQTKVRARLVAFRDRARRELSGLAARCGEGLEEPRKPPSAKRRPGEEGSS